MAHKNYQHDGVHKYWENVPGQNAKGDIWAVHRNMISKAKSSKMDLNLRGLLTCCSVVGYHMVGPARL